MGDKETGDGFVLQSNNPSSKEALPSNLDLHSSLPTQIGVIDSRTEYVYPINSIDNARSIEFQIQSHQNELIDPQHTYFCINWKITDYDGHDFQVGDGDYRKMLPTDGIAYNLFKNCKVKLNDVLIDPGNGLYSYRADLENKLMIPQRKQLNAYRELVGFYNDLIPFEDIDPRRLNWDLAPSDDNHAQRAEMSERLKDINARWVRSANSKLMTAISKIHSEIFEQPKFLPPNSKLNVTFDRNDVDDFSILSLLNNAPYKIVIDSAYLLVRYVTINRDILLESLAITEAGENMVFPVRRVEMTYYSKGYGLTDLSHPNLFHEGENLPRRLFIGFVKSEAFQGDLSLDPFKYNDLHFEKFALRIGGQTKPLPLIKLGDRDSALFMWSLMEAAGVGLTDNDALDCLGNARYNIFGFDLTSVRSSPYTSFVLPKSQSCDFELTLQQPLNTPHIMIVYAEYDGEIIIDKDGHVSKNNFATISS